MLHQPGKIALLVLAAISVFSTSAQTTASSSGRTGKEMTFEPSSWTPTERMQAVENGLINTPIILAGMPTPKGNLLESMQQHHDPGLSIAVVDNGRIAWVKGYGVSDVETKTPVTPETLFSAGGLTKWVTGVAVVRLVQQKKIDLDEDVNKLLDHWKVPDSQFTQGHPVTLRQLLSHSSGIDSHYPEMYPVGSTLPTLSQMLKGEPPATTKPMSVTFQPGASFDYSSGGYLVIQQVLEDVFKKPFAVIVNEEVFKPAGMQHSTFKQPTPSSTPDQVATGYISKGQGALEPSKSVFPELAGSGLWTTPTDLARLLINIQNSGKPGSLLSLASYQQLYKRVVSDSALGSFVVGDGDAQHMRARTTDGHPNDNFVGWMIGYVSGGKGAIVMANSSSAMSVGFALLRSVSVEYGWPDYVPTRQLAKIDPAILQKYVGKYRMGGQTAAVTYSDGYLRGQIDQSGSVPLYPVSQATFFVNTDLLHEAQVDFVTGADGKVEKLVMSYPDRGESFDAPRIP